MSSLQDELDRLQRDFAVQLGQRLHAIEAAFARVAPGQEAGSDIAILHGLVYGLAGSAGSFGMPALAAAARNLEAQLATLARGTLVPSEALHRQLAEELQAIGNLIAHGGEGSPGLDATAPMQLEAPLVELLDDVPALAGRHVQSLHQAGYRTRLLGADRATPETLPEPRPAALVVDMMLPEGVRADSDLAALMRARHLAGVPVVLVSLRDDVGARLAARRAGACRYLTKPIDSQRLLAVLDELLGRRSETPFRVLLVESDPHSLADDARALQAAGIEAHTLDDPMQLLSAVDRLDPELLLLGLQQAQVDGAELSAILRERDHERHLPIVFLAEAGTPRNSLDSLGAAGDDLLVKPVDAAQLLRTVTAHARRARHSRGVQQRLRTALYEREREHLALDRHAIVSTCDGEGRITYANDRFCEVSGYRRDELLGRTHRLVRSQQHPPDYFRTLWRTLVQGRVWQGEICNRRKDGRPFWIASTITPFLDAGGRPYQFVSIATDISHVKEAEADLRAQRDLQRTIAAAAATLLDAGPDRLDAAIDAVLRDSGQLLGADRAYLIRYSADGQRMTNSNEWCAQGIAPCRQDAQGLPAEAAPWWRQQMLSNGLVVIPDVAALPAEASAERQRFLAQGIRSMFAFSLQREGHTYGFVGFDTVRRQREWSTDDTAVLQVIADLIGSALSRVIAERALQRSQDDFRATLESTKDGILAVSADGKVSFANRQFLEMWRLPADVLQIGCTDTVLIEAVQDQLLHPQPFRDTIALRYQAASDGVDILELRDGRVYERHCRPFVIEGVDNGLVWSFHDITDNKRAERALQRQNEFQSMVAAVASDFVAVTRDNVDALIDATLQRIGQFFAVDRADVFLFSTDLARVSNTHEWCREGIACKRAQLQDFPVDQAPWYRRLILDNRAFVHVADVDAMPEEAHHEQAMMRSFGIRSALSIPIHSRERIYGFIGFDAVLQPARWSESEMAGLSVVAQIIASALGRVELDRTLIDLKEQAEAANAAKTEFLSRMSHELRTPMNAILGFGQLLAYDSEIGPEQKDNVDEILKAGRHLLELINEVLDLARIESGRIRLSLESVALDPVIDECLGLVSALADARAIRLHRAGPAGLHVCADRTRLKQTLLNLLSNAIKYNRDQGDVVLEVGRSDGGRLRISVIDSGPGIAEDQRASLFQPFCRLGAENSAIEGTGIGLALSKRLVEMMQGRLDVDSRPGQGSRFWIDLPSGGNCCGADADGHPQEAREPTQPPTRREQWRVLYIEDNPANLRLVGQLLSRQHGLHMLAANSARLGIELARTQAPDLVLLDINMPEMDGYQVLHALREDPRTCHITVVAVTANAMPADIERGRLAGFHDYLTKPIDLGRFETALRRWLMHATGKQPSAGL